MRGTRAAESETASPSAVAPPVLRCVDVGKSFRGVHALESISISVEWGEIAAVIGPNGAGKTTLFNCICGNITPDSGRILLGELDITGRSPSNVAHLGIARTFQNLRMFEGLTAFESVLASLRTRHDSGGQRRWRERLRRGRGGKAREALELLEVVGIAGKANNLASELALVEQRRLEVARALATHPQLLLADEPAAGSTPAEARELEDLFRRLVEDRALTIVLIEHTMSFVLSVASVVHVLDFGRIVRSGSPSEIRADDEVRRLYVGRIGDRRAS